MKRFFLKTILFLSSLVLSAGLSVSAQSYMVYRTNGTKTLYPHTEVDSIVYSPALPPEEVEKLLNGHGAVDLGLPSGTLWATCNVGASNPGEYGAYYAWGETEEKETYTWATYRHCDGTSSTCRDLGADIAGTEYDAAHVNWGGGWKMPTQAQFEELLSVDNCTWTWTETDGADGGKVNGYEVKSKANGNSIFLPAAGFRYGSSLRDAGSEGSCWGSAPGQGSSAYACYLGYNSGGHDRYEYGRHYGRTVRPALSNADLKDRYAIYKADGTFFCVSRSEVDSIVFLGGSRHKVIDGHEAVDLGLPSGTKWATCNVGASSPEEYGGYYAWGETEEKNSYTYNNSLTYGKSFSDISGTGYDVACMEWGGGWKMPTLAQFGELSNTEYCTWTWTTQHGSDGKDVNGYEVRSRANGNSIFLPAAGYRHRTSLYYAGSLGGYWSSTPVERDTSSACSLYFYGSDFAWNWDNRYYGRTVRPVLE